MRRLVWVGVSDKELISKLFEAGYRAETLANQESWESPPPLFIVNFAGEEDIFEQAKAVRAEMPGATGILLLCGDSPSHWISRFINEVRIFRVIFSSKDFQELLQTIHLSREKNLAVSEKSKLLDESRKQNRELGELTANLEKIVEERTTHIQNSKQEAEVKLSKMRRLVRLIKELGSVDGLEDLMRKMRRELKRFHGLGEPTLVFSTGEIQQKLMSFRAGKFLSKSITGTAPALTKMRMGHGDDQKFLANCLSRPVTRLIALPLKLMGTHSYGNSVLYIEHDLPEGQVEGFISGFSQLVQPLGLVLDRLLLEYRLRKSSFQWEYTFDGLPSPIAIINDQFETMRSNQLFEPSGKHGSCYKLFGKFDSTCVGCPVATVIKSGRPQTAQINVEGKIFRVHSYPIRLSHSLQISHVVNYYVDITRSRELYGKVIQNEKMAAVGLLAGNIAHELNNPLTGIRSLSQVLRTGLAEDSQLSQDLCEVEKASERSQKTIKNLLEFSSTEKEEAQLTSFDDIVERTLPMLKTAMRYHRSHVDLNTANCRIRVEGHLLQQVVFNLVNNACQAMTEAGEIRIHSQRKGKQVELSISDTGPGIPEKIRSQVFEPFFTTKEEGVGTGLGLSMSKSIVEKFGGEISFDKEVLVGTKFYIRLPIFSEVEQELS